MSEAVKFLEEVLALGYPCRGITSDLDTSLTLAIEHVYAEKPHQYCINHALGVVEKILGYHATQKQQHRGVGQHRTDFERLPLRKGLYLVKASKDFLDAWQKTRISSTRARAVFELRERCRLILSARSQSQACAFEPENRQYCSTRSLSAPCAWRHVVRPRDNTPGASSSNLEDVVIVNDTLAYAVGCIYLMDEPGAVDPLCYNFLIWNGRMWDVSREAISSSLIRGIEMPILNM